MPAGYKFYNCKDNIICSDFGKEKNDLYIEMGFSLINIQIPQLCKGSKYNRIFDCGQKIWLKEII